ncbi:hypothetical protein GCM10007940_21480 [Portibacter lacus]|uniref:Four helix bundle protein n=2 Tax=Portibacter lacus TaxID=1099794 RepID=A0AA37WE17_9BACT|nr:hypothetical protein GCM10007940_21480 [Portibacter lacus]
MTVDSGKNLFEICKSIDNGVSLKENNFETMKNSIVGQKAYSFALEIILVYKNLTTTHKEFVLSKQLLRSGTAVGALIQEAEHAQSKADFLNKMNVALKEANETCYWISLLKDSKYISESTYNTVYPNSIEILKMLISIVKTTKNNLNRK